MDRFQHKVLLLKEILARKTVLFGQCSEVLTKHEKIEEWKCVHAIAQAFGLCPQSKDHTYTRDVVWQNIRKAAMKKKDISNKFGSCGVEVKFTEIDKIIFEILDMDSPAMDPIYVPTRESLVGDSSESSSLLADSEEEEPQIKAKKPKTESYENNTTEIDEIQRLEIEKTKLEIELLKKQNVLKELQIIKLSNEIKKKWTAHNKLSAVVVWSRAALT